MMRNVLSLASRKLLGVLEKRFEEEMTQQSCQVLATTFFVGKRDAFKHLNLEKMGPRFDYWSVTQSL